MTGDGRAKLSLVMHHYCIVVPDLEEAVQWYSEMLDFGKGRAQVRLPGGRHGDSPHSKCERRQDRDHCARRLQGRAGRGAGRVRGSAGAGLEAHRLPGRGRECRGRGAEAPRGGDRHGAQRRRAGGGDQLLDQGPGRHHDRVRRVARPVGRIAAWDRPASKGISSMLLRTGIESVGGKSGAAASWRRSLPV